MRLQLERGIGVLPDLLERTTTRSLGLCALELFRARTVVVVMTVVMVVIVIVIVTVVMVVIVIVAVVVFGHGGEVYAGRRVLCREARENPRGVELWAQIRPSADRHEVA